MSDRRIHGISTDGGEIVRYERAGKWYIEYPTGMRPRRALTVRSAASLAALGRAFLGKPGGMRFDAKVREFLKL